MAGSAISRNAEGDSLGITQARLDNTDLVVLVDPGGAVEWSSKRSRAEVVNMLHKIALGIEDGTL
jgi:hypothetical protein